MNILSYIHVHRLPNPSGVGRVIDRLLTSHANQYPGAYHRMLVDRRLYDRYYLELGDYWKRASFIPHRHSTSWQQAMWLWRSQPLAEQYWGEVEVVYCPAESYVPTRQAKLVCTIHDVAGFEDNLYPLTLSRRWHCSKWRILFKEVARHAAAVVTVSKFSASRIIRFFPDLESKLHIIYNAPHPIFGSEVSLDLEHQVKRLSGGAPYVLVPGGLSLRKNAKLIIDSVAGLARSLPEVKLIVAGSNESPYVDQIRSAKVPNVVLTGYVSDELLNALYQRAEVVWFPSRYEGFGMPAIEAMASGAAVVASATASLPEVTGEAALLCDVNDPDEHVDAISSLVASSQTRQELCLRSKQQAAKFSWTESAGRLEEIFRA